MELMKNYKRDRGITKKWYSRSVMSKLQIISGSIAVIVSACNLIFWEYMNFTMAVIVAVLISISLIILMINSYVLKIEPNDEMSRTNYYKASESTFAVMSILGCFLLVTCGILDQKNTIDMNTYEIFHAISIALFLGFVIREMYFLKYERAEG